MQVLLYTINIKRYQNVHIYEMFGYLFVVIDAEYLLLFAQRVNSNKYWKTAVTSITLDMDTGRQVRIEAGKSNRKRNEVL